MSRHPEHCRTVSPADLGAAGAASSVAATAAGDDLRLSQLPPAVRELLTDVLVALDEGHAVTVTAHESSLTTQEAADVLGVSRPTLVRLLEEGAIPYEQPGSHRRVRMHDVLAFQRERTHAAEAGTTPR